MLNGCYEGPMTSQTYLCEILSFPRPVPFKYLIAVYNDCSVAEETHNTVQFFSSMIIRQI